MRKTTDNHARYCGLASSLLLTALLLLSSPEALAAGGLQDTVPASPTRLETLTPEMAVDEYLARLTPQEREKSNAYWNGGYGVSLLDFLLGLIIAWLLLNTRLSERMRNWAQRRFSRRPIVTAAYAILYILVTTLVVFPFTVYAGWWREHQYDLSTQGFWSWLGDFAIGLGLSLLLLTILVVAIYGVIRRFPGYWWLWGTVVMMSFLVFMLIISPVFVAPLFNTYTPMDEGPLKERILQLASASGVPAEDVYQFDASRQSKRISANVSGFLGTMRISLNDNLLERCTAEEVAAVMAHEIGHYVLNHMYEMLVYFSILVLLGFLFVRWGFDFVLKRWGRGWGIQGIGDVAGLPLLVILFSIYVFLITPVTNNIIRSDEVEADHFGLAAARAPDGFAEAAFKLAEYRKLDPSRLEEWLFYDHPSGRSRILMAMRFKAAYAERAP
jgi:STE24 endopeptidase